MKNHFNPRPVYYGLVKPHHKPTEDFVKKINIPDLRKNTTVLTITIASFI